ncbi:cis-trans isomerase [Seminavis robusta]|uniref:Cis-trans isomerase n=1 Tax=Seminavis robusta TaxID=568900 RepID=A0A9N8DE49_9STRA|nr:cis-trans isomerase [Seminavis robusta]|eukprot:Sro47_g027660.1 cis-trans isomerase (401) ;mRNA; r:15311-16513
MASGITAETSRYCFLDLDFDDHRAKLATAAGFVDATDTRYGFTSQDLRLLGGSEISRVKDLIATDHEWSSKATSIGVETKPPVGGNRVVVELYWEVAPMAAENFATLCANGSIIPGSKDKKPKPVPTGSSGKPLSYRGSTMHRCVPGFVLQGGDFVLANGSGGESIYNGKKFKDERAGLNLKHDQKYILSMGNSGKNANSSQFFFTFDAAPQCDGKHVIFGRAISGFEVLDKAETLGTPGGDPTATIRITDCGVFGPLETPGAGYWYDAPDPDSFSGVSPIFMVLPRVAVLAPSQAVLEKFQKAMGDAAIVTLVSAETYKEEDAQISRLNELLGSFFVDVIVVAPVCKAIIPKLSLPKSWSDAKVTMEEAIIDAKPVEAIACVRTKSWLAKRDWRLEGTS